MKPRQVRSSQREERLAVSDMRDSAVFFHMYIEPVLDKVLGHHLARLNDPVLLRERPLCKELRKPVSLVGK